MSTEIITSPDVGVLLSLASDYLFGNHRVRVTFDLIEKDSKAYNELEQSEQTRAAAQSKEDLRNVLSFTKKRRTKLASTIVEGIASLLAKKNDPSRPASTENLERSRNEAQEFMLGLTRTAKECLSGLPGQDRIQAKKKARAFDPIEQELLRDSKYGIPPAPYSWDE